MIIFKCFAKNVSNLQKHTDEKPFQCKICETKFNDKYNCMDHIRIHDDRFKLKCSICDQRFAGISNLIKHGDKYHNGQGYTRKNRLVKRPRLSGDLAAIGDAAMGTGFELTNEMPLL